MSQLLRTIGIAGPRAAALLAACAALVAEAAAQTNPSAPAAGAQATQTLVQSKPQWPRTLADRNSPKPPLIWSDAEIAAAQNRCVDMLPIECGHQPFVCFE